MDEIKAAANELGLRADDDDIELLFQELDTDHSGMVLLGK